MRSVALILLISLSTFATFAGEISEFNLQNQFSGAACNVKRWPRLLARNDRERENHQIGFEEVKTKRKMSKVKTRPYFATLLWDHS